ncbi:MAG: hypothetical protein SchgKO_05140 [Schleiferiaceae bacterium]
MKSISQFLNNRTPKEEVEAMVHYVSENPEEIPHFIEALKTDDYTQNQQAGWVIGKLGELSPFELLPYIGDFIEILEMPRIDGVHRNVWRGLQFVDIPEEFKGPMLEIGLQHFEDQQAKVAIRVFALKTITPLVEEHPELIDEIRAIVDYSWKNSTPGFKSITRNTLKKWDKQKWDE